jgi:hypothetical protein
MKRTVLVLGAGASVDFGLPTGEALTKSVEAKLTYEFGNSDRATRGDELIYAQSLRKYQGSASQEFFEAARTLSTSVSYSRSIDDALFKFGHNNLVIEAGKVAIVSTILDAENKSWLNRLSHPQVTARSLIRERDTLWILKLLRLIQSKTRVSEANSVFDNLSIINFNYDRCIEHFLMHALQFAFSIGKSQSIEILTKLNIIHPYGTIGVLPWTGLSGPMVNFGQNPAQVNMFEISANIRTFTEQQDDSVEMRLAKHLISIAEQIVFVGFGYHQQNVEFLSPTHVYPNVGIYGTAFLTSSPDREHFTRLINEYITKTRGALIPFSLTDCSTFIGEYGLSLFG